jgi:hypothetical protein
MIFDTFGDAGFRQLWFTDAERRGVFLEIGLNPGSIFISPE